MPQFPTTQPSYALRSGLLSVFPAPLIMQRAPTPTDRALPGTIWIDARTGTRQAYILIGMYAGLASWLNIESAGGAGIFANLTVNPGPVALTSSQTTITGTANTAGVITQIANGGAAATILIQNTTGTSANSVRVTSTSGGVTIDSGKVDPAAIDIVAFNGGITIQSGVVGTAIDSEGDINITSTANDNAALVLKVNGGTAERLFINSVQGTGDESILIESNEGGITISTVSGGTSVLGLGPSSFGAEGNVTIASTSGVLFLQSGESSATAIQILSTDVAGGIKIESGTGGIVIGDAAVAKTIQIGDTTGLTDIELNAAKGTAAGAAITINAHTGVATLTGVATGAGLSTTITITNNKVTIASGIIASAAVVGAEDAQMMIQKITPNAGSITILVKNNGAAVLASNLIISFMILS